MINNACATQAILSILLNSATIDLGEELINFKSFVSDFPAEVSREPALFYSTGAFISTGSANIRLPLTSHLKLKGHAISNSDVIRTVHNSFARSDPFVNDMQDPSSKESEDLFHFIAYTPINGNLYELDGLQEGPRNHGPCPGDSWLDQVGPIIQERMDRYAGGEIRFNLMAIVDDRIKVYESKMTEYQSQLRALQEKEGSDGPEVGSWLRSEIENLKGDIQKEQDKRTKQARENKLRRHNFVPLIYEILKGLAQEGKLSALVDEGKERAKAELESAKARKKAQGSAAGEDDDVDMYGD